MYSLVIFISSEVSHLFITPWPAMDVFKVAKKDIYLYMKSNYRNIREYVPWHQPFKWLSVYPLAWNHLWHLGRSFLFAYFAFFSKIWMSRSYNFSLPSINFSIYFADCILGTVFLEAWAFYCKGFHEFGRLSLNMAPLLAK